MKFNSLDDMITLKVNLLEAIKDSPIVLYVAFYEPLNTWLKSAAEEWNPVLQLMLNIIAILYGVARLIPIFKKWFSKASAEGHERR